MHSDLDGEVDEVEEEGEAQRQCVGGGNAGCGECVGGGVQVEEARGVVEEGDDCGGGVGEVGGGCDGIHGWCV